jgi:hypothetical protein
MKRVLSVLVASALLGVTGRAIATTPEDAALAEQLFRDGKEGMAAGRYAEACPKLAESHRLDPAGGTLLTLALCHEAEGRTASAWAEFTDALAMAKRDGRADREAVAREHATALLPRLRRLAFRVAPDAASVANLVIRRDGVEVGRAAWDVAAPVDPGVHVIEALAPGYEPFSTTIAVEQDGATATAAVPLLVKLPTQATPPVAIAPGADAQRGPSALRIASYVTGGVGIVSLGLGTAFAISAKSKRDDANATCPTTLCNDAAAVDASQSAGRAADIATGAFIVGAVALAGGVALFLLSRDGASAASAIKRAAVISAW